MSKYEEFLKDFENIDNLNEEQLKLVYSYWNYEYMNDNIGIEFKDKNMVFDVHKHTKRGYNLNKLAEQHRKFDKYLHCLPIDMTKPLNKIAESIVLQYIYKQHTEDIPDVYIIPTELLKNAKGFYEDRIMRFTTFTIDGLVIDYTNDISYNIRIDSLLYSKTCMYKYVKRTDFQSNRLTNVLMPLDTSLLIKSLYYNYNSQKIETTNKHVSVIITSNRDQDELYCYDLIFYIDLQNNTYELVTKK